VLLRRFNPSTNHPGKHALALITAIKKKFACHAVEF